METTDLPADSALAEPVRKGRSSRTQARSSALPAASLPQLSQLPSRLRKATPVIHSYAVKGDYSHLCRRVYNVLAVLANRQFAKLPPPKREAILRERMVLRHNTTTSELAQLLGFPSNHKSSHERIVEAVRRLYQLEFRWNVMEDGDEEAVEGRLLTQFHKGKSSPVIRWEYPPDVFRMIVQPKPYALLDLHLANTLSSAAALALYENTCRYIANPSHLTAVLPVEEWVHLLCGQARYTRYTDFKRYVLKPAMAELASSAACPLTVALKEYKASRGAVTHLQFEVRLKTQLPLNIEHVSTLNPDLERKVKALGISETTWRELIVSYEEAVLQQQYDLTMRRQKAGGLRNPAAYFLDALRKGYVDAAQQQAELKALAKVQRDETAADERRQAELRRRYDKLRSETLKAWFTSLPLQQQHELEGAFVRSEPEGSPVARSLTRKGLSGLAAGMFLAWLAKQQPEALRGFEDFEAWAAKQEGSDSPDRVAATHAVGVES